MCIDSYSSQNYSENLLESQNENIKIELSIFKFPNIINCDTLDSTVKFNLGHY